MWKTTLNSAIALAVLVVVSGSALVFGYLVGMDNGKAVTSYGNKKIFGGIIESVLRQGDYENLTTETVGGGGYVMIRGRLSRDERDALRTALIKRFGEYFADLALQRVETDEAGVVQGQESE